MNISIYGVYFLPYISKLLKEDGHKVFLNHCPHDSDICIVESRFYMYNIYKIMKMLKKNKIKLINFILDIPLLKLIEDFSYNNPKDYFKQFLYNSFHKNQFLLKNLNLFKSVSISSNWKNKKSKYLNEYCNTPRYNRVFFLLNYKKYLNYADLNLSLSKYTQKLVKRHFKLDTKICYPCVNSEYLLNLPKTKIKYDSINISRIVLYKRQEIFVEAANRLNLNVIVLGKYVDKSIKLNCPHFYYKDHKKVINILNQTKFYVAPTIFEGFGMTSVEAAFLDKPVIASDIYVHRDVLGDFPLYFERDNIDDLIQKMHFITENNFIPNTKEIKKKYSIPALKRRLIENIEAII